MGYTGSRYGNHVAKHYNAADLGISATITILQDDGEFAFPFIPITEYSMMQWIFEAQMDPAGAGSPIGNINLPNRAKDSEGVLIEGQIIVAPSTTAYYNTFVPIINFDTTNRLVVATYRLKEKNSFNPQAGFYAEYSVEQTTVQTDAPFPSIAAASFNLGFVNPHTDRDLFINNPRVILFD